MMDDTGFAFDASDMAPPPDPFDAVPPPPEDDMFDGGPVPEWVPPAAAETDSDPSFAFQLDETLNPGQREAATKLAGPVMAIAGPGAGKTKTLVQRIGMILESGVPAGNIVALTFTNKAGREIRDRVGVAIGASSAVQGLSAGTFHSWCLRFLKREWEAAGIRRSFEIIDDSDRKRLIRAVEKEQGTQLEGAAKRIGFLKGQAATAAELHSLAEDLYGDAADLLKVMARYDQVKEERGEVDFDDLLLYTLKALQVPEVAARTCHNIRHLLVDEYQDTNPVQHALVQKLAGEADSVFIVGDTDQSVYKFRGAAPGIMPQFVEDFEGTEVVVLEDNYRSTSSILSAVRHVIDPNPAVYRSSLNSNRGTGVPVSVFPMDSDVSEANLIVDKTKKLVSEGVSLDEVAVLVRTRAPMSRIEVGFVRAKIPYRIAGGGRIQDSKAVKDTFAWLRLSADPTSVGSLERIVAQVPGVGPKKAEQVTQAAGPGGDLVAVVRDMLTVAQSKGKAGQKVNLAWQQILDGLAAIQRTTNVVDAVSESVRVASQYLDEDSMIPADDLEMLAGSFLESNAAATVVEFLDDLALTSEPAEPDTAAVTISTVHAAKGKEWGHVFVAAMESGIMPLGGEDSPAEEQEEERRIAFVAMSRAKDELVLSFARERVKFGQHQFTRPSKYLYELQDAGLAWFSKPLRSSPARRPRSSFW